MSSFILDKSAILSGGLEKNSLAPTLSPVILSVSWPLADSIITGIEAVAVSVLMR